MAIQYQLWVTLKWLSKWLCPHLSHLHATEADVHRAGAVQGDTPERKRTSTDYADIFFFCFNFFESLFIYLFILLLLLLL